MQDSPKSYYISYEDFLLKKHWMLLNAEKTESAYIYNSANLYYPPLKENSELPMNGIFIDNIVFFKPFVNLKQFYLEGIFVNELPDFFSSFKMMERMQICFSRSTNVESVVRVLLKMPSLKYIDINSSKLSEEKLDYLLKHLTEHKIKVFVFFNEF